MSVRWRFPCALVVVYAFLAVEIVALGRAVGQLFNDSAAYLRMADSLAQGRGMVEVMRDGSVFVNLIRPPGYPAFLAIVRAVFGESLTAPVVVQALLVCLAIEIVRRQVERLRGRALSLLVPALAALTPGFLVHVGRISSESPALALHVIGLALATAPTAGVATMVAAGLCLGGASLFRQNVLVVPVQIALADVLRRRRWWAPGLLVILVAALVVIPWAERNRRVGGTFSPVSAMPQQFRFTYYQDIVMADDVLTGAPLGARRYEAFTRDLHRVRERYLETDTQPPSKAAFGGVGRVQALVLDLNRAARDSALRMGWPRILAWRLGYFLPRAWITSPKNYPRGVPAVLRAGAVAIQILVLVAGVLAMRSALGLRLDVAVGGLLVLSALEVLWHGAGTVVGLLVLALLAGRMRGAELVVPATWASVTALFMIVLAGRHTEVRYAVPHYPLLIGLAAWEAGRWRWPRRLVARLGASPP